MNPSRIRMLLICIALLAVCAVTARYAGKAMRGNDFGAYYAAGQAACFSIFSALQLYDASSPKLAAPVVTAFDVEILFVAYSRENPENSVYRDRAVGGHLSATGHAVAERQIASFLSRSGLLEERVDLD